MKATPRITSDFDEYPELRVIIDVAVRRVVELMELHDIIELRRIRKNGVFDRPYVKDVVTPIGLKTPSTISAVRYAAGKALLDYLEIIGVQGIALDMTKEDALSVSSIWSAPKTASTSVRNESTNKQEVRPVKVSEDDHTGHGNADTTSASAADKTENKEKEREDKND